MADRKLSDLSSLAAPTRDDLLYVVDDPAGTPTHYNATVNALVSGPSLLVAASNASADAIKLADYACDGTADDVQIAAALAALPSVGGTVRLTEGTFNLTGAITLPAKPARLVGQGSMAQGTVASVPQATVLAFTLGGSGDCISFANDTEPQAVEGCEIYGDGANTRYGLYVQGSPGFKCAREVTVGNVTSTGVRCDSGSSQCYFERVYTLDLDIGFNSFGVTNTFRNCQAMRSAVAGVGGTGGFIIHDSGSLYVGCMAEKYEYGFDVSNYAAGVQLVGCSGELNNSHIRIEGSPDAYGISVLGFHGLSASHATRAAIYVDDALGVLLAGCNIKDSTSNKTFEVTANSDTILIRGGFTNDTTPITNGGATRLDVRGLYGYVAENKGAASSISDGGTIAHGLSGTPAVALVSPSVASEMASVTGLGATNITVAIKKDDGSAGTSQTIYWRAYL